LVKTGKQLKVCATGCPSGGMSLLWITGISTGFGPWGKMWIYNPETGGEK